MSRLYTTQVCANCHKLPHSGECFPDPRDAELAKLRERMAELEKIAIGEVRAADDWRRRAENECVDLRADLAAAQQREKALRDVLSDVLHVYAPCSGMCASTGRCHCTKLIQAARALASSPGENAQVGPRLCLECAGAYGLHVKNCSSAQPAKEKPCPACDLGQNELTCTCVVPVLRGFEHLAPAQPAKESARAAAKRLGFDAKPSADLPIEVMAGPSPEDIADSRARMAAKEPERCAACQGDNEECCGGDIYNLACPKPGLRCKLCPECNGHSEDLAAVREGE